jgi:myo-inositol catabolism protein IolH
MLFPDTPLANFRLAVDASLFASMPIGEALKAASECGYAMVEIGLSHFDACAARRPDVEVLKEQLSLNGLGIAALFALPGWDPFKKSKTSLGISSPDEVRRKKAVEQMRYALDVARLLGCRTLASELSGDMDDKRRSRRSFLKSIEDLLPELQNGGATLFFEAHPGDFIEDSFEAVELLASLGSERIRYNYCIPHTFILGHSPREIVRNAGRLLGYVHFADTLMPGRIFFSPTHPPKVRPHLHMIPGEGDVNLGEVISGLASEDFDGYLTAQPFSSADEPVKAAKKTKAVLMRMLADHEQRSWESH